MPSVLLYWYQHPFLHYTLLAQTRTNVYALPLKMSLPQTHPEEAVTDIQYDHGLQSDCTFHMAALIIRNENRALIIYYLFNG